MNYYKLTFSIILFAIGYSSLAQKPNSTREKIITKFEIFEGTGATRNAGNYSDIRSTFAYSLGFGLSIVFRSSFEITVRTLWESKGSEVKTRVSETNMYGYSSSYITYYHNNFKYFTCPLILTYRFGPRKTYILGSGGYFSYLAKASIGITKIDEATNIKTRHTITSMWNFRKRYDGGVTLSAGEFIPISDKSYLTIQLIFNKGLADIHDVWNEYQRNNVFLFAITYNFLNHSKK